MANLFPRSSNYLPLKIAFCALVVGGALTAAVAYYITPKYWRVGYEPLQPVTFPHDVHVAQLGMDCRYCHSFVEVAAHSNIPTTQTCMNCHTQVQANSPQLTALRDSWVSEKPVDWVQVHKTPDYAYYNHAAHVNRGISCVTCHGDVHKMSVVRHDKPHSMAWCLECHREPENHLRPLEQVYNMEWKPPAGQKQREIGLELKKEWNVQPPVENCAGCHR